MLKAEERRKVVEYTKTFLKELGIPNTLSYPLITATILRDALARLDKKEEEKKNEKR